MLIYHMTIQRGCWLTVVCHLNFVCSSDCSWTWDSPPQLCGGFKEVPPTHWLKYSLFKVTYKKLNMVVYPYNSSIWKAEVGELPWVWGQPGLHEEFHIFLGSSETASKQQKHSYIFVENCLMLRCVFTTVLCSWVFVLRFCCVFFFLLFFSRQGFSV